MRNTLEGNGPFVFLEQARHDGQTESRASLGFAVVFYLAFRGKKRLENMGAVLFRDPHPGIRDIDDVLAVLVGRLNGQVFGRRIDHGIQGILNEIQHHNAKIRMTPFDTWQVVIQLLLHRHTVLEKHISPKQKEGILQGLVDAHISKLGTLSSEQVF